MMKKVFFFLAFGIIHIALFAQTDDNSSVSSSRDPDVKVLYTRQRSFFIMAHTHGFGLGARLGSGFNYYKKYFYEAEVLSVRHPKQIKTESLSADGNPFVYGQLNYLYMLRAGVGLNKILNDKPTSGGVQVACYAFGGLNLGMTRPTYLYILYPDSQFDYRLALERYDPAKHDMGNIYGGGPFLSGFAHLKVHPGLYAKVALQFEFGEYHEKIRALEVGAVTDFYFQGIPMMAYNTYPHFFFNFYLSFHFGSKYNR